VAQWLYVGNLSYRMTSNDLHDLFAQHGTVQAAQVIVDRDTWRSKGFGFVEMASEQAAQAAINALNGQEVNGVALTVAEARPREEADLVVAQAQRRSALFPPLTRISFPMADA
jgi:cold-inducible RNA-binding protein